MFVLMKRTFNKKERLQLTCNMYQKVEELKTELPSLTTGALLKLVQLKTDSKVCLVLQFP